MPYTEEQIGLLLESLLLTPTPELLTSDLFELVTRWKWGEALSVVCFANVCRQGVRIETTVRYC